MNASRAAILPAIVLALALLMPTKSPSAAQSGDAVYLSAVDQIGGSSYDLALTDEAAYLATGTRLTVLGDLQGDSPVVLDRSEDLGGLVTALTIHEGHVYVTAFTSSFNHGHLHVLSIGADQLLSPVASLPLQRSFAESMDVAGSYLLVAGYGSFDVFDIRDPAATRFLHRQGVSGLMASRHQLTVLDGKAWVTTESEWSWPDEAREAEGLTVFSIDERDGQPARIGGLAGLGTAIETINGAIVQSTRDGLRVVDPSDPANPRILAEFHNETARIAVSGNILAHTARRGFKLLDLSSPEDPQPIRSIEMEPLWGLRAYAGRLYTLGFNGPLQSFDVGDPANPVEAWKHETMGGVCALTVKDDLLLVPSYDISERNDVLSVFRVNLEGTLETLAHLTDISLSNQVVTSGDHAILSGGVDGPIIVDVRVPEQPTIRARLGITAPLGVALHGARMFVGSPSAIHVFDVVDFRNAKRVGSVELEKGAAHLMVVEDHLYAVDVRSEGMYILDVAPEPKVLARMDFDAKIWSRPRVHAGMIYASGVPGLHIFELSDPLRPVEHYFRDVDGLDMVVHDGLIWTASGSPTTHMPRGFAGGSGVEVYDLEDPLQPEEIEFRVETKGTACAIAASGEHVFIGDRAAGLLVYERSASPITTPTPAMTRMPTITPTPVTPTVAPTRVPPTLTPTLAPPTATPAPPQIYVPILGDARLP